MAIGDRSKQNTIFSSKICILLLIYELFGTHLFDYIFKKGGYILSLLNYPNASNSTDI